MGVGELLRVVRFRFVVLMMVLTGWVLVFLLLPGLLFLFVRVQWIVLGRLRLLIL